MKSGNKKTYSFKSVGRLDIDEQDSRQQPNRVVRLPIGIKTPLEFTHNVGGLFKMHTRLVDQVADNFRNMIMTNHGERVGHYDFGANLIELAFELGNEEVDSIAMRRIAKATQKYMPFIQLDSFEPFVDHHDNEHVGKIGVRVTYTIPTISAPSKVIEVLLYVAG